MLPGLDALPLRKDWLKLFRRAMGNGGAAFARAAMNFQAPNYLDNPDGAIYQRAIAATADDVYMDDRWYALTQTGTITPSQLTNPEDGFRYGLRLTQSQAAAQRMGRAQIVPAARTSELRGKTVTAGGRKRLSTGASVRCAILAWTGTEDAVTSDVVNSWTNAVFTTGNFFNSTTLAVVATNSIALSAAVAGDVSCTGVVPATATNLIYFYWTEGTAAQNVTLDAWGLRLVEGQVLADFVRNAPARERAECQKRYVALTGICVFGYANANLQSQIHSIPFPVTMASAPTVTITSNGTLTAGWSTGISGTPTVDAFGFQVIANAAGHGGALAATATATCDL